MCEKNQVKIIDFGIAFEIDRSGSDENESQPSASVSLKPKKITEVLGTPFYMAPEALNRQPYDEKFDVWSLGIILYVLLTGKAPFYNNGIESTED